MVVTVVGISVIIVIVVIGIIIITGIIRCTTRQHQAN
jgi:hypothetical protein